MGLNVRPNRLSFLLRVPKAFPSPRKVDRYPLSFPVDGTVLVRAWKYGQIAKDGLSTPVWPWGFRGGFGEVGSQQGFLSGAGLNQIALLGFPVEEAALSSGVPGKETMLPTVYLVAAESAVRELGTPGASQKTSLYLCSFCN